MEDFRGRPKDTQHQQDTHKRRQVRDGLEDRHEDESTDAQPEDDVTLCFRELADLCFRKILFLIELSLEGEADDDGRDDHRDEGWDKDFRQYTLCGDDTLDPQHDGSDVADRGEGTT